MNTTALVELKLQVVPPELCDKSVWHSSVEMAAHILERADQKNATVTLQNAPLQVLMSQAVANRPHCARCCFVDHCGQSLSPPSQTAGSPADSVESLPYSGD